MKLVIDISGYNAEWIRNAYGIPQEINTNIAESIINAEPYSDWIPVAERLPEEDGRYLVCGAKGGIYHANYRGGWWTQVGCGGKLVPSVVAWMPLPEPYKGVTG